MHRRTTNFNRHDRVQGTNSCFEWSEKLVLVWKETEMARRDAQTDTGGDVILRIHEPDISLRLLEYVVENCIVRIVIHDEIEYCDGMRVI